MICLPFAFVPMLWLLAVAESQIATLSLGGFQQYNPPGAATPTLTGNVIDVSGGTVPEEGVDIIFSPDLHALIQSTVDANCQEVNERCLQSVTDLVSGPSTELQARQILVTAFLLFEVIKFAIDIAIFLLAAAAVVAAAANDDTHNVATHMSIPPAQLSHANSMSTATATVVIVDGVPPFTITPKPAPTGITGTHTPIATSLTSATNGHNAGDVLILLPDDFAKRIDGFIRRSTDCAAAGALEQLIAKRVDEFGPALCGAQGVIMNAVPGGPFADIQLMGLQPLPFAADGAVRAMNAAMQFARNWAIQLQMTQQQAELFGVAVFAITELVNHQGVPLGTDNTIPAESLSGTITQSQTITSAPTSSSSTSSSSSSSGCTACYASCSYVGIIQGCETACVQVSSCSTNTASEDEPEIITTATVPWYDAAFIPTQIPMVPSVPLEECAGGGSSFPFDAFSGSYGQFCTEVEKVRSSLNWNVDSVGNKIQALRRRKINIVAQRSPPVNLETWSNWRVNLNWIAGDAPEIECTKSCSDAFKTLANSCGNANRGDTMFQNGKLDVRCGTYLYQIVAPPAPEPPKLEPPKLGDLNCHAKDEFGTRHVDVDRDKQKKFARQVCESNKAFNSETEPEVYNAPRVLGDDTLPEPYRYEISWIVGCQTSEASQKKLEPIKGTPTITCFSLMEENYKKCINGGAGGFRDAGCLRYRFDPWPNVKSESPERN